ncbi:MAG: YcbK family protein [Methylococcales bacterium]
MIGKSGQSGSSAVDQSILGQAPRVGKAIDVRLPDISTRTLRNLAVALEQGGVGYYRKSDFVHIDTGRVGTW